MNGMDPIREAEAVKGLRESIAALDEDDALLVDTIEGETSFFEIVDALLSRIASDRVMIEGTKAVRADLEARAERFERRIKADRALIEQAMMIADLSKIERPVATLSLTARAAKVEITTEADIPAEFWKAGAPTLDKKALLEALKARREAMDAIAEIEDPVARAEAAKAIPQDIPGATLGNSAPTLTIRTK